MIRIFISSVQKEFAAERAILADYLKGDALLCRFCEVFLFENIPASSLNAQQPYLERASTQLVRRRFVSPSELIGGVYASLVEYLTASGILRFGPFDASPCTDTTLADLSEEKLTWFLRRARQARGFPLDASASPEQVLTHLRLLNNGTLTNAAILLE